MIVQVVMFFQKIYFETLFIKSFSMASNKVNIIFNNSNAFKTTLENYTSKNKRKKNFKYCVYNR